MRDPKDRLYRVLVIGANPAGLAATNKLGEMGIPVTLVDPEPDLDRKLSQGRMAAGFGRSFELCPETRVAPDLAKPADSVCHSRVKSVL